MIRRYTFVRETIDELRSYWDSPIYQRIAGLHPTALMDLRQTLDLLEHCYTAAHVVYGQDDYTYRVSITDRVLGAFIRDMEALIERWRRIVYSSGGLTLQERIVAFAYYNNCLHRVDRPGRAEKALTAIFGANRMRHDIAQATLDAGDRILRIKHYMALYMNGMVRCLHQIPVQALDDAAAQNSRNQLSFLGCLMDNVEQPMRDVLGI